MLLDSLLCPARHLTLLLSIGCASAVALISGCTTDAAPDSSDEQTAGEPSGEPAGEPAGEPGAGSSGEPASATGDFTLRSTMPNLVLVEGDSRGLNIPFALERRNGHTAPVTLRLEGRTQADVAFVTNSFERLVLGPDTDRAQATLRLEISNQSIPPQTRDFIVVATDGTTTSRTELRIDVEPVDAPDVYLLLGQSNMVGSSGNSTRLRGAGEPDAANPRVQKLNIVKNDGFEIFDNDAAFSSPEVNFLSPAIVTATDPLHIEPNPNDYYGPGYDYIGPGLTFGKSALDTTSRSVVLVPAAWSGSAFCDNDGGPRGQWNAQPTSNPVLGNTLLFDRALLRANQALAESGGILRGILWHQGESDGNTPCATVYGENLALLASELRSRIDPDLRGPEMRGPDAPIPFIVGTMSRGVDERGDYSDFNSAKALIDQVHRTVSTRIPHSGVSIHDDLTPANGYPCGNGDCIHFGPEALREMGRRYYGALQGSLTAARLDTSVSATTILVPVSATSPTL